MIVLSGAGDEAFCAGADLKGAAGRKRGLLMMLSGEPVNAREAFEMGLVSRVVPRERLEAETSALATTLAAFSPTAVGLMKEAAATTQDMEDTKALRHLRELLVLVGLSDDAKEGIAAFFEKRPPQWKGR